MSVPMLRQCGAPSIASAEIDTTLRRYLPQVEPDPQNFRRGRIAHASAPSARDRLALEARRAELIGSLNGDTTEIRALITMMRNAFRSYETEEEAALNLMTWMLTVEGMPVWAVKATALRFIRAQIPKADDRRGPTPAEFVRALRPLLQPVMDEIRNLETVLLARVEEPIDEAKAAETRAKVDDLVRSILDRQDNGINMERDREAAEAEANLERLHQRAQQGFGLSAEARITVAA